MKVFVTLIILSLLGICYTSLFCDTSRSPENGTDDESYNQSESSSCVPLYANNRKSRGGRGGQSVKRNPPSDQIDPTKSSEKSIRELVNMEEIGRFNVKHMFMDGRYGSGVNSFDELKGNPEALRNYLLEVNRRMFKGNVLPVTISSRETFKRWIIQAMKNPKKISLVDADLKQVQHDIGTQQEFRQYLEHAKNNPQDAMKNSLFTTTNKYHITEIILTMHAGQLLVKLERYVAKLKIGMKYDEIYHWDPFDRSVTEETVNGRTIQFVDVESPSALDETTYETSFTYEQLKENEKLTLDFWKDLFAVDNVEKVGYKGPINDVAKRFSRFELKYRREWLEKVVTVSMLIPHQEEVMSKIPGACPSGHVGRRKRDGMSCAFFIDSEGNVESIQPEEFMEVFKRMGEEGRRRMLEKVKNNGNKYVIKNEINAQEAVKHLNQLVHHDEMTTHAELVEMTGMVQDWRRWKTKVPNTASEFVTAMHETISTRMNKIRLSGGKIVSSLAKNPNIESINKAGKAYGHLMVTKGIINGIIHNDTTSLIVIGTRFSYDIVTDLAVKVGTKFFNAATKVGKAARVLSKVAGPIGAAIDIGLGAWSLSKSVDRLKKADNKYDRDDAIADIVSESIDMAVTITVTVLSVAFPPAAPVIAAVGLIISVLNNMANAMFHAANQVARIDAQIPLLGFEKVEVFKSRFFDIFGTRGKDYVDYLVEEKNANDKAVATYLDFLKNNTQFSGVVFPSRTLAYEGSCHLKVTYGCDFGTWVGHASCWYDEILGRGCDWNEVCSNFGRRCMDEQLKFEFFDCICDKKAKTEFGVPHRNSRVDFQKQQSVFWERAVPGDVAGTDFKCKPSSLRYIDYKKHQLKPKTEYHCENAIGLYRPRKERKNDQSFLVNLEDGNDDVFVDSKNDQTHYTFWMGEEGRKHFNGGKSKNDFILNGNCSSGLLSGTINGGPKESDSLIITPTCGKGKTIHVKKEGTFYYVKLEDKLNVQLKEIENIIGRPNEAESVEANCNTKGIFLNGGASAQNPDYIYIDALSCPLNIQTMVGNYTNILSRAKRGEIAVFIGEDMTGSTIHIRQQPLVQLIRNPTLPDTKVIFTQTKSQEIIVENFKLSGSDVSLKIKDNSPREPLTLKYSRDRGSKSVSQYQLFFNESSNETPNTFSVLLIPGYEKAGEDSSIMFYHNLQPHLGQNKKVKRVGSDTAPNVFRVFGRNWDVRGGVKNDVFLLNIPLNQVRLDGGGGNNTLVIESGQNVAIDLRQSEILNGIQTIVKGTDCTDPIEIYPSCEIKAVAVDGRNTHDIVKINSCSDGRELQIDAGGSTRVFVEGDVAGDKDSVQILAHKVGTKQVTFELDTMGNKVSRLFVHIPLASNAAELYVHELVRSKDGDSFRVNLRNGGPNNLIFKLTDNYRGDDGAYISSPRIHLVPPKKKSSVQLVFRRDTLEPVIVHHVNEEDDPHAIFNGFEKLENLFQFDETSRYHTTVYGGKLKDTFIGTSKALSLVQLINANTESDNTLVVKDDLRNSPESQTTFKVDLSEKWMGLLSMGSTKRASVQGHYHHLVGRANQPDTIVVSCATKTIAGRGGSGKDKLDAIEFKATEDCKLDNIPAMELYLGPFTKVENQAALGSFKYFVDLTQYADYLSFSLHPNGITSNKVIFTLPPLEKTAIVAVWSIEFDKEKKSLTFTMKDRSYSPGVYEFLMYQENEEHDYSDPQFLFTTSGDNWVTSDVKVDKKGSVIATSLMYGDCSINRGHIVVTGMRVDVNNLLVNITGNGEDHHGNCGRVQGNVEAKQNHIWLYNLPNNKQFTVEGADNFYFREDRSINSLYLGENFHGNKPLTTYLSPEQGLITDDSVNMRVDLRWIDNFAGRNNPKSYDIVVPSCYTNQVSGVDLVRIVVDHTNDCVYDLVIGIQPTTRVDFKWIEDENDERRKSVTNFWNSTFHYRMSAAPMSFEVVQSYPGMLDGTVHNLYLSFDLDDLETLEFDVDESKLYYTVDSEEYSITMIAEPDEEDQFYPQPNMITSDGFRIQIGRDGSVLATNSLTGVQPEPRELLSNFQEIANALVITMIVQTDNAFLHIGNDGSGSSDRNVLQNVASNVSWMGGGGAADIYEVVSLNKDVYISTGLENVTLAPVLFTEGPAALVKQTIDLTDIVAPIRFEIGIKYKPRVVQQGNDLIIIMEDFLAEYPGKVVVYNGATDNVRKNLQILLSNAMMEFNNVAEHLWELSPVDVHLERETVYSIAAEDLEHNHRVIVLDHKYGREYRFGFSYIRKDDDLQLTDIEQFSAHKYDKQHIEMTTVIITDFYKDVSSHRNSGNNDSYDLPTEIRNVTLLMPGLTIMLNGTEVRHIHNDHDMDMDMDREIRYLSEWRPTATPTPPISETTISKDMVPKWNSVLHDLENDILEGLPFVNRTF